MILEVERKGEYRADSDLPVEITITRFGKVNDSTVGSSTEVVKDAGLPAAADEDEPVDTTPGIWFDDAAKLDAAGMKVTTDIVAGETHFYKVPVGYGQMLRGGIRAVSNQEEDTGENTIGDALHLNAYNSARAAVRLTKDKPSSRVSENFHEFSHFSPSATAIWRAPARQVIPGWAANSTWLSLTCPSAKMKISPRISS